MPIDSELFECGAVSTATPHVELLYGSADDMGADWVVVARLGPGPDSRPVVQFLLPGDSPLTVGACRHIEYFLGPDYDGTSVRLINPDRRLELDWFATLVAVSGTASNLYGEWHWRPREGAGPSTDG